MRGVDKPAGGGGGPEGPGGRSGRWGSGDRHTRIPALMFPSCVAWQVILPLQASTSSPGKWGVYYYPHQALGESNGMNHLQWLIQESEHDPGVLFRDCSSPEPTTQGSAPSLEVIKDLRWVQAHPIDWSGPTGANRRWPAEYQPCPPPYLTPPRGKHLSELWSTVFVSSAETWNSLMRIHSSKSNPTE